jgi:hypothetical protein
MTRRAARIDDNQRDIVTALERAGCTVQSLASLGEGVPDLLVGVPMRMEFGHGGLAMWQIPARNIIIEVKDGAKPPSRRRLTEDQIKTVDKLVAQNNTRQRALSKEKLKPKERQDKAKALAEDSLKEPGQPPEPSNLPDASGHAAGAVAEGSVTAVRKEA